MSRAISHAFFATLLLLAGCGGGEEPERSFVGPVDCRAQPELCV